MGNLLKMSEHLPPDNNPMDVAEALFQQGWKIEMNHNGCEYLHPFEDGRHYVNKQRPDGYFMDYYRRSAEMGNSKAWARLNLLAKASPDWNIGTLWRLYRIDAYYAMGECYITGQGTKCNIPKGVRCLVKAVTEGTKDNYDRSLYQKALTRLGQLAEEGEPEAIFKLGCLYYSSNDPYGDVKSKRKEANRYFKKAILTDPLYIIDVLLFKFTKLWD